MPCRPRARSLTLFAAGLAIAALHSPAPAHAEGTFFLVELSTGIGAPAYTPGEPVLSYGGSAGITWRWRALPFRFSLLTTFTARDSSGHGLYAGVPWEAGRRDLDLFLAQRVALPIWGPFRIYGELGFGERWTTQTLDRGEVLGRLSARSHDPILVVAGGLEARISTLLSLGLRAETTPLDSGPDLIGAASSAESSESRVAFLAQLGVHF